MHALGLNQKTTVFGTPLDGWSVVFMPNHSDQRLKILHSESIECSQQPEVFQVGVASGKKSRYPYTLGMGGGAACYNRNTMSWTVFRDNTTGNLWSRPHALAGTDADRVGGGRSDHWRNPAGAEPVRVWVRESVYAHQRAGPIPRFERDGLHDRSTDAGQRASCA